MYKIKLKHQGKHTEISMCCANAYKICILYINHISTFPMYFGLIIESVQLDNKEINMPDVQDILTWNVLFNKDTMLKWACANNYKETIASINDLVLA